MDIVIIGTGNVATVLGRKFRLVGHRIVQVVGRDSKIASALAYEWNTVSTNYNSPIIRTADFYLLAIADSAIPILAAEIKLPGKIIAHTAASVPMEALRNISVHHGVFYPLQSLRKEMNSLPDIPVFYDGSDDTTKKTLEALAHSISGKKVIQAGDEGRAKLHVAAVVVSNFVNHLYKLAEDYCKKEGLDFSQLAPLIKETAQRIEELSPSNSQTGPASRHDVETIKKHLELLKDHPQLRNIYLVMTESIQEG